LRAYIGVGMTPNARKVLDALRDTQAIHEQDVRRLRDELEA
jgi:hypothetical protein